MNNRIKTILILAVAAGGLSVIINNHYHERVEDQTIKLDSLELIQGTEIRRFPDTVLRKARLRALPPEAIAEEDSLRRQYDKNDPTHEPNIDTDWDDEWTQFYN